MTSHLVTCSVIKEVLAWLGLDLLIDDRREFLFLAGKDQSFDHKVLAALINFANYQVCNLIRHSAKKQCVWPHRIIEHISAVARCHPRSSAVWTNALKRRPRAPEANPV